MSPKDEILIKILAATDAVWLPSRRVMDRRHAVICERRVDYATSGVVLVNLAGDGAGDAERKAASRAVAELVKDKMVMVKRPRWARAAAYRLSEAGDCRARALVGLPRLDYALLQELANAGEDPRGVDAGGLVWHSESTIVGRNGAENSDSQEGLAGLAEILLPALVRGLVVSNCDMRGRCWYALTPEGLEALKTKPPRPGRLPKCDQDAAELYTETRLSERERMATQPLRRPGDLGQIPFVATVVRPGAVAAWAAMPMEGAV